MKRLKTIFACMLMALFSIGQVWADTSTLNFTAACGGSGTADDDAVWAVTSDANESNFDSNCGIHYGTKGASVTYVQLTTSDISGTISQVVVNTRDARATATVSVTVGGTAFTCSGSATATNSSANYTFTGSGSGEIVVRVDRGSSNTKAIYVKSVVVTYTSGGSTPFLTVAPTSWNFGEVAASASASKVFSVSGSNLTAGTLSISVPAGFSVSPSSISVTEATLAATNVTVSKNTTAIDDYSGNLSISATCGLTEAKTVALNMSVVEDPEPTGTFELFSGDLEEGDYVLVYATYNNAMKASQNASSNRMDYMVVSPAENKLENPDASIVWHIAPISETSYWTIYSEDASKYIGSTSSNNQAKLLDGDITDAMKWTVSTGTGVYDFVNVARQAASGNPYLRNNDNGTNHYGFACYANGTGGALTLYKKQIAGQPKAPTFSVPGGNYENAQSVELSCETTGATIRYTTDGSAPSNTSAIYSTAIPVNETTTIKAIAIKDNVSSSIASATYTIIVWQTVADVWNSITVDGPTNAHIYGYVSQTNVGGYANNFYISDNGSTESNQLYAYRMDMNSYSVEVGDKVKLAGDLTIVNDKKQFKYANSGATQGKVIALEAKGDLQSVAVDGTPTKTEYAANEDFDPAGLKVYGTYANGFVGEITEGITWGNDLTDSKVIESTTVHVTATVSGKTSPAYDVAVTVAAKTLESIAVGTASYTIYTGETLPKPVVTATFSEGEPEDVSAFAVYDSENVFDTEVIDNPNPQTITVSYTFGGATETVTYTVSVKDYANANDAPYTVTEALHIITDAIGSTESAREIVVAGTVNEDNISNNKNRYKISDGENELLVYAGKGFDKESFTNANYPKEGDVVVVKGNVINYNSNTPEFASGKSYLLSQVRPTTLAIEDIASFEVGATDLTENDLDITTASDGDITFVSGDETKATIVANVAIHAVAPGTVTITANLAATSHEAALNYAATSTTFDVTVVAATVKYAITFDGNDNTGGEAPEFDAEAAEGANITLPANTYTKSGKIFDGWKVINNSTTEEVEVTAGAFTMPASAVTIQAQWADPSVWALTYTSNLELKGNSSTKSYAEKVKITVEEVLTEFDALRACTGSAAGSCTIKVPAETQKLHFHAAAWNAKPSTITVTMGETELLVQALEADGGIKNSSPYTLEGIPYEYYYCIDLSSYSISEETTITFSAGSDKRFVLFGVNQEGGVVPVLDHITITGTMTNTTGWKTGDNIVPEGLTVNAIYTLNNVEQTPVEVDPNDVVWSHEALVENQTEVTLTASYTEGEVVKSANVNVTIAAVETGDPTIITNPASYLNFGASVEKDAVVNPKTITVTLKNITSATATLGGTNYSAFSIDNTAIVDGTVITVSVNTATPDTYSGTVTIKDNNSETEKVITLSMTVVEPEVPETAVSTESEWVVATEVADGMEVLITGVKSDVTYAISEQANNNRTTAAGTLNEEVFTPGANTMSFTLVAQGEGTYALRASNGNYLYAASSSGNQLKTRDAIGDDGKAVWTISINGDNEASIVANCETTNWRNVMQFNQNGSNNPVVACYASASQSALKLYVPKPATPEPPVVDYTEVRNGLTEGWYYTMCLDKAVTAVQGGTIWRVLSKAENGSDIILEEVTGTLEAGRPYIFLAAASTLEVAYTGDAVLAPVTEGNNGLVGSFSQEEITQSSNNYILYNNAMYYVNSLAYVGANRAYLNMDGVPEYNNSVIGNAPGRRRVVMNVYNGNQMPTGIEGIEVSEAPRKVMIDGQLFILRDKKMYDASGRLVK